MAMFIIILLVYTCVKNVENYDMESQEIVRFPERKAVIPITLCLPCRTHRPQNIFTVTVYNGSIECKFTLKQSNFSHSMQPDVVYEVKTKFVDPGVTSFYLEKVKILKDTINHEKEKLYTEVAIEKTRQQRIKQRLLKLRQRIKLQPSKPRERIKQQSSKLRQRIKQQPSKLRQRIKQQKEHSPADILCANFPHRYVSYFTHYKLNERAEHIANSPDHDPIENEPRLLESFLYVVIEKKPHPKRSLAEKLHYSNRIRALIQTMYLQWKTVPHKCRCPVDHDYRSHWAILNTGNNLYVHTFNTTSKTFILIKAIKGSNDTIFHSYNIDTQTCALYFLTNMKLIWQACLYGNHKGVLHMASHRIQLFHFDLQKKVFIFVSRKCDECKGLIKYMTIKPHKTTKVVIKFIQKPSMEAGLAIDSLSHVVYFIQKKEVMNLVQCSYSNVSKLACKYKRIPSMPANEAVDFVEILPTRDIVVMCTPQQRVYTWNFMNNNISYLANANVTQCSQPGRGAHIQGPNSAAYLLTNSLINLATVQRNKDVYSICNTAT